MLFLTIAMMHVVTLMSPGPDLSFVSQAAISRSRKETITSMLGITCGVIVWAGIALFGLYLIIEKAVRLHILIMMDDGLYPYWMGHQVLRSTLRKEAVSAPTPQVELAKNGRSFFKSLPTNLANPKAVIHFGLMFSLFVGDSVDTTERWGIFTLAITEAPAWFTVVANLLALPQMCRGYQRLAKWIDGFTGALLTGFDIHLIVLR